MEQPSPIPRNYEFDVYKKVAAGVAGSKAGDTNPQAPAPEYSDRLSQLEKDMAEIKDGTIKKC